jgi:hypothetical protein
MTIRRLVTATDENGKSYFAAIGVPPRTVDYRHTPGYRNTFVWTTPPQLNVPAPPTDLTLTERMLPPPGGTTLVIITMPPDSVMDSPGFSAAAAEAEHMEQNRGGGAVLDPENPGMHITNSVDYIVMLEGSVWAEMDNGVEELRPGDILIQNGTRHAWRNRSDRPATFAAFVVGARRSR